MTVKELRAELATFPQDLEVAATYDAGLGLTGIYGVVVKKWEPAGRMGVGPQHETVILEGD